MALTPNGRVADASPLGKGPRRLSNYEREIAHALMRKGKSKRDAIRMARGLLKKAAASGRWGDHGKAGARTRAGARASIAQRRDFAYMALGDTALIDLTFNPAEARDSRGRWTDALDRAIAGDTQQLEDLVAADHGPSRITMPQLSGVPAPGSKADQKFRPAPGQEVDLTDQFMAELEKAGVSVQTEQVPISDLHPTQDELVGSKVAGLAKFMLKAPADSPVWEPIFVSADDHVIDGHHRWAARIVRSKIDNNPGETMAVRKIGLNIADALPIATQFMREWGLPVVGMDDHSTVSHFKSLSNVTTDAVAELLLAYNPNEARDSEGRWTDGSGVRSLADITKFLHNIPAFQPPKAKPLVAARPPKGYRRGKDNKKFPGEPSYDDVAEDAQFARRDTDGSDGTNNDGIWQQALAQIHAKTWDSIVDNDSPDDVQYANSIWEAYQNPDLYKSINNMLRTGKKDPEAALPPEEVRRLALAMFDMAGYTTSEPMKVYRALKTDSKHDWAKKLKPGTIFEEPGIVSTTAHKRFSEGWLALSPTSNVGGRNRKPKPDDVMLEIQVPAGTRILGGTTDFIETMLKPGSKFKIVSSEQREATDGTTPLGGDDTPIPPFTYTHVIAELQP